MVTTLPKAVKLWGRGQLTIPKDARRALNLEEDERLSVFVVGRCLVLTPKRLVRPALAREVEKTMKTQRISLEDVLAALKVERKRYNREQHAA